MPAETIRRICLRTGTGANSPAMIGASSYSLLQGASSSASSRSKNCCSLASLTAILRVMPPVRGRSPSRFPSCTTIRARSFGEPPSYIRRLASNTRSSDGPRNGGHKIGLHCNLGNSKRPYAALPTRFVSRSSPCGIERSCAGGFSFFPSP
jgi:hypothetical protein